MGDVTESKHDTEPEHLVCSECNLPITDATYFWGRHGGQWHHHCHRLIQRRGEAIVGMDCDTPNPTPVENAHISICRDCRWHADTHQPYVCPSPPAPEIAVTYVKVGDICDSPKTRRQDPVSGGWFQQHCKDVNDGYCPHFEVKEPVDA